MNQPPKDDTQFETQVCERTGADDKGFVVHFRDGFCLHVHNDEKLVPPKPGEEVRLYGKGMGYAVRGVTCGDRVYFYSTQQAFESKQQAENLAAQAERARRFADELPSFQARVGALPAPMRKRIEFFMRRPSWGPEFGGYELFCCESAVKIAAACKTPEAVYAFRDAPNDEQRKVLHDLNEHSGNTFGCSCQLAVCLLREPEILYKVHGALCPLVGCEDYGCYCMTEEAAAERTKRG